MITLSDMTTQRQKHIVSSSKTTVY